MIGMENLCGIFSFFSIAPLNKINQYKLYRDKIVFKLLGLSDDISFSNNARCAAELRCFHCVLFFWTVRGVITKLDNMNWSTLNRSNHLLMLFLLFFCTSSSFVILPTVLPIILIFFFINFGSSQNQNFKHFSLKPLFHESFCSKSFSLLLIFFFTEAIYVNYLFIVNYFSFVWKIYL